MYQILTFFSIALISKPNCSESFVRGGPTLTIFIVVVFILVDEGREDPSTTISGPSSARQRNAIKWHFAGVPMMAQQ